MTEVVSDNACLAFCWSRCGAQKRGGNIIKGH